jgi:hypothetical protein
MLNNPVLLNIFGTTAISNGAGANPSKVVNTNGLCLTAVGRYQLEHTRYLKFPNNATLGGNVTISAGGSFDNEHHL